MDQTIICLAGRKRTGKESVFKLLYPYVADPQEFQFATPLKKFCMEVLGLTHGQCYGTDFERESPTKYRWGDVAAHIREKYRKNPIDIMTARDVLQVVGTDLIRESFYMNTWAEAGVRNAVGKAATCIYTDTRFLNEIDAICKLSQENNFQKPLICRLYRQTGLVDMHSSEFALDSKDLRSNQRSIEVTDTSSLKTLGYKQLLPNLWQGNRPDTFYDFLIDNNSTLESLKNAVMLMIQIHGLYREVTLS